ncbi:MAG TPA: hypothetical protein QF753_10020 [Victivallales bacterium]|nr:hypothetical protein [Victivallales bacterium]
MNCIEFEKSKNDFESFEGESNTIKMIIKSLLGFDMILSAYIPIILFSVLNSNYDITVAYIATFFWGLFCQLYFHYVKKIFDPISMIFLVYSICKLAMLWFISVKVLLTYSTIFECSIYCIIIITLNLLDKPIWQLFAEKADPKLLEWKFRESYLYKKIWKEVSNIWLLSFVIKAVIIYLSMKFLTSNELGNVYIIMGTPFAIFIICIGIWYPKHRWIKIFYKKKKETLTKHCT